MVEELDFAHMPNGQMGRRALVERVSHGDQAAERHFLEIKSEIDLNTNEGRSKVAKFILGAANRDPATSASRFDGYALMFLGIGAGTTPGIDSWEAMELQRYVSRFTGTPGPGWDFERVDVEDGRSVVIIMVAPSDPEQQPWICHSEGIGNLHNGRTYLRADGETREATASELQAMIARSRVAARPQVDLSVEVLGEARSYVWDEGVLDDYIERKRAWLLDALPKPPPPSKPVSTAERAALLASMPSVLETFRQLGNANLGLAGSTKEPRTQDEYRAEIDAWEADVRKELPEVLERAVGAAWPAVRLRISNLSETYLDQPAFRIHLAGPVDAVARESEMPELLSDLPKPPRRWGPIPNTFSMMPNLHSGMFMPQNFAIGPQRRHGVVRFENGGSVDLDFSLEELRPTASWISDDDDLVLVLRDETVTEIHGTWEATVRGHDAVYNGTVTAAVASSGINISGWVENQLRADKYLEGDDDDGDGD